MPPAKPLRLLFIDHHPYTRVLASRELRSHFPRADLRAVGDEDAFRRVLDDGAYDVAITEARLPWASGVEIVQLLKAGWPERPVVMYTVPGFEGVALEALKAGLDDYVFKMPGFTGRLAAAVQKALESAEVRRQHRDAEEALRRSRSSLALAQRIAGLGSWEYFPNSDVSVFSEECFRIFGLATQPTGPSLKEFLEFVVPRDQPLVRKATQALMAIGAPCDIEFEIVRPDGSRRIVHVLAERFHDDSGELRVVGTSQDVTERVLIEAERQSLLESEQRHRADAEAALERLRAIQSVTETALAHLGLDELLNEMLTRIRAILAADAANVLLLSEDRTVLAVRAWQGLDHEDHTTVPVGRGIAGTIAARREPMVVEDLREREVTRPSIRESLRSLLGVPLLVEGDVVGVLEVGTRERRSFTEADVQLLQLVGDRVALAIDRARLFEAVRAGRERLQALSRRLVELQDCERHRIARELHDEVGQLLTGLKLMIESGVGEPGRPSPNADGTSPRGAASSGAALELINELIGRVRDMSMNLRPPMLDELGLLSALLWHIERYSAQTRLRVEFHHDGVAGRFPPDVETAAFRIVQEALTNVARHASTGDVRVRVRADRRHLEVRVEDDGAGFDLEPIAAGLSSGLAGMRERARLVGGQLTIRSAPGGGTIVAADLPLRAAPRGQARA
jgi:PAS domain S-box-containing protein